MNLPRSENAIGDKKGESLTDEVEYCDTVIRSVPFGKCKEEEKGFFALIR